jgi:hypothetical protein
MLWFADPGIVAFDLATAIELSDFSVLFSIEANGSLERAAGFGEGVLVKCGDASDASDGGGCEFVFAARTLAGLTAEEGDEVEVCHSGG